MDGQEAGLVKVRVSKAANRKAVGLIVAVHVAVATVEVQVGPVSATSLGTAPVVAVATSVVKNSSGVIEVACG